MTKIVPEYTFTQEQNTAVQAVASACGLHEVTARILVSRGVDTPEKAKRFLSPSREHFLSPFLMRGMREAILRGTLGEFREEFYARYAGAAEGKM